ncbi:MAG TPA: cobalamin-binding protein [Gammaproteobacteria bacterium]|nr:cobalamin-binding protein [Gammaproteobacteria bacterium]
MRLLALLALAALPASADILLHDDEGVALRLEKPAARVVALAPHFAELMFEIGAGERVVGAVDWTDTPEEAKRIPRVGDGFRIDVERVIAMKPDMVLAWGTGTPRAMIETLRRFGLPVAVLVPDELDSIGRHVQWLGRLTGRESQARQAADAFRQRLEELRRQHAGEERLRVFYQINDPLLFTVGGEHIISEAIRVCGGENVFAELGPGAHAVTLEAVLARSPQVIVIGAHDETLYPAATRWKEWLGDAASIHVIDANDIARPTLRMLGGVQEICTSLAEARVTAR